MARDCVNFDRVSKNWGLYDLFKQHGGMPHHAMPEHDPDLYTSVQDRFRDFPNVKVIEGKVPEIYETSQPNRIVFLHLDMNNADTEIGAVAG